MAAYNSALLGPGIRHAPSSRWLWAVADGFEVGAVGVGDEGAVVVRVVLGVHGGLVPAGGTGG